MIKIFLTLAVAAHTFAGVAGAIREKLEGEIDVQESQITHTGCMSGSVGDMIDRNDATSCGVVNDPGDDNDVDGWIGPIVKVQFEDPVCVQKIIKFGTGVIDIEYTCTKDGCTCTQSKNSGECSMYIMEVGDEDTSGNPEQDDCFWLLSYEWKRTGRSSVMNMKDIAVFEKLVVIPDDGGEDGEEGGEGGEVGDGGEGGEEGEGGEHRQYSGQSGLTSSVYIATTVIGLYQLY